MDVGRHPELRQLKGVRVSVSAAPPGLTWQLRRHALLAALHQAGCDVTDRRSRAIAAAVVFGAQSCPVPSPLVVRDLGHDEEHEEGAAAGAQIVVCADAEAGARYRAGGTPAVLAPTVVDCDAFAPPLRPRPGDALPRLGWLPGSADAAPPGLPALLGRLGHHVRYALDVSGADARVQVPGVLVRHRPAPALAELPGVLSSVDVLLVTPGPDRAAAVLVAAASGVVPVVLAAGSSDAEESTDVRAGEQAGDADSFVRLVSALLSDPELRAERSVRGRAWVVRKRRLNAWAPRISKDLFEQVASLRRT